MTPLRLRRRACAAALLSAFALGAAAHDSWLAPAAAPARAGTVLLEMATGTRFPIQDVNPTARSVTKAQCADDRGRAIKLAPQKELLRSLQMQAVLPAPRPAQLSCWVELIPFDIELAPAVIPVYLDEIRASAAVRAQWAAIAARGLPWKESYRKFARIELATGEGTVDASQPRKPAGLDIEILMEGNRPVAVGEDIVFTVLRDGQPLADFPLELVSERLPLGVWKTTDAQGRVTHKLPFAGRWLLRGTDLRLSPDKPDSWYSRFVTLTFEAPAQPRKP